jgi:hypothetical protein
MFIDVEHRQPVHAAVHKQPTCGGVERHIVPAGVRAGQRRCILKSVERAGGGGRQNDQGGSGNQQATQRSSNSHDVPPVAGNGTTPSAFDIQHTSHDAPGRSECAGGSDRHAIGTNGS